ncbi:regulatory-associated protein of mTOR [Bradysia coprophila]|uniref:regulatory-associated protein of mTOR n=1 Tax=Bradysia coprophila TaxID=38358 RepID=UPI00187DD152|nr:regulatory-associated protein of mTOR [Bradysia coprophila]
MIELADKLDFESDLQNDNDLPVSFSKKRHEGAINSSNAVSKSWRIRDRMKTVSVALVVCLNVGVDPPDVFKITPCARLECWIDPTIVSPQKAIEMIGASLQKQYERWQPRARYKSSLDPTVEDVKKLCSSLRRNAKEERVLFHYNGHGVPRPTVNGEIWVFNRTYTQYIPLSIYDLQTWMGAPSIYVYDCSNAGIIVNSFNQFADQHEREMEQSTPPNRSSPAASSVNTANTYKNCIQLAACAANQILPMNPQLPADLFTACLTTPIRIALKWFTLQQQSSLVPYISQNLIERYLDKIPGQLNDRRTMLGELNWIFTAITDTIAWNTLPRDLFQKLFRQDLLVASLFRNFLLAERIMRSYDCTPISSPALPNCFRHPMWSSWDLAVDLALQQLPNILENGAQYQNSPFFEDQLTAFHVWLEQGNEERSPPEQLPIVLQVLLSQVHRLRALALLGRFLDLGPWAVNLALSVGIFPYVLKLLQASAKELRPLLVFIWAKILAVDNTCQVDLVCDQGHKYFLSVLQDHSIQPEYRTLSAFVLASIVHNFPLGQANALQGSLVSMSLVQIADGNALLRQWLAICLGHLWQNYDKARWSGVRDLAHEKLYPLLEYPEPEVRTAAVYALGTFISSVTEHKERTEHANNIDRSIAMTLINVTGNDMSPLVRMELVAALQWMVILFENQFVSLYHEQNGYAKQLSHHHTHSLERNINMKRVSSTNSISGNNIVGFISPYKTLWQGITSLRRDPHPDVAEMADKLYEFVSIRSVDAAKEASKENFGSSLSLPPSPNTRTVYLNCSNVPPSRMVRSTTPTRSGIQPPRKNSKIHINEVTESTGSTVSEHSSSDVSDGSVITRAVDETQTSGAHPMKFNESPEQPQKPIVHTNFIPWAVSLFSSPSNLFKSTFDRHAPTYLDKMRRFQRNEKIRSLAKDEQRHAIFKTFELTTASIRTRAPMSPTIVRFHPYNSEICVVDGATIWTTNWKFHCYKIDVPIQTVPIKVSGTNSALVNTIEFINPQFRSLLLAGYEDGCVRLWQHTSQFETDYPAQPRLVTAFQALFDVTSSKKEHARWTSTCWQQRSQTIVVGGDSKSIRLWDAESEMKKCDIPTGLNSCVSELTTAPNELIAASFDNGIVLLFDKRCPPAEARIKAYNEPSPILATCLRDDCESLIVGYGNKNVRLFDIRQSTPLASWAVDGDVTSMAIHSSADFLACYTNDICIYGLDGHLLNSLRPSGSRSQHLSFHPLRAMLAASFRDHVLIYQSNDKCQNNGASLSTYSSRIFF